MRGLNAVVDNTTPANTLTAADMQMLMAAIQQKTNKSEI